MRSAGFHVQLKKYLTLRQELHSHHFCYQHLFITLQKHEEFIRLNYLVCFSQDTGVNEILRRVKSGKFHIPNNVSVDARSLIGLLLQAEPRNRVSAQEILKHSFMIPVPQTVSTISKKCQIC